MIGEIVKMTFEKIKISRLRCTGNSVTIHQNKNEKREVEKRHLD